MDKKEKPPRDICMSHSARADRDAYRICPSKLSKRELEDLYYNLLDNNINLKQTINVLQEKLKIVSTKLQRSSAEHKTSRRDANECCSGAKELIKEQRESIEEMKRKNANLIEKNQLLTMRLCSTKQFLNRCSSRHRSSNSNLLSMKNSSHSALNTKRSENNLKNAPDVSQNAEKEMSGRVVDAENISLKQDNMHVVPDKLCDENKCRTQVEELKQNIIDLKQELTSIHEKYSCSISRLKHEVNALQDENIRITGDRAVEMINLQQLTEEVKELKTRLREAEAKNGDLAMHLSMEKSKVAELETILKSGDLSNQVAKTIGEHLKNISKTREDSTKEPTKWYNPTKYFKWEDTSLGHQVPVINKILCVADTLNGSGVAKSDDSGYTEANKSNLDEDKALNKLNKELLKKIAELQAQVDILSVAAAGNSPEEKSADDQGSQQKILSGHKIVAFQQNNNDTEACCSQSPRSDDSNTKSITSQSPVKDNKNQELTGNKHLSIEDPKSVIEKVTNQNSPPREPNPTVIKNKGNQPIPNTYIVACTQKNKTDKPKKKHKVTCECHLETTETPKSKHSKLHEDTDSKKVEKEKQSKKKQKKTCQCTPNDTKAHCKICPQIRKSYRFTAVNSKTKIAGDNMAKNAGARCPTKFKMISVLEQVACASAESSRTYTLEVARGGRESPLCTDHEISTMTDLPSERGANNHQLSPGEDRGAPCSESYSITTDYSSLSVGEVPGGRRRKLSVGEKIVNHSGSNTQKAPQMPERVEDALQMITEELTRCRRLLLAGRPVKHP